MPNILLVEDNRVNQIVATRMLDSMGYGAEIANNGKEAVDKVEDGAFDLILMDCQMPEMDGYTATRIIKEKMSKGEVVKCPIIALTAHAMSGDREKCEEAGMDDFLTKPVDEDKLQAVIHKCADNKVTVGAFCSIEERVRGGYAIDINAFEKLADLMGDKIKELVKVFETSVGSLIDNVEEAISSKDYNEIMSAAHTIKSPARQVGANKLADAAFRLETMAKEEAEISEVEAVFPELRPLFDESLQAIKKLTG